MIKKKNINEAIEDVAVSDMNYSTMGHVYADAIRFRKKRLEDAKRLFDEKRKDLPNEDRYAHTKINSTKELKKMHLSEDAFQEVKPTIDRKVLKEAVGRGDLASFIKNAVEGLKAGEATNYRYKIDDRLAVFVGWSEGYDPDDDGVIHSVEDPTYAITAGIKVWTSDDMWTDFDWLNFPYEEDGEVWDNSEAVSVNYDANKLARSMYQNYDALKGFKIAEDGKILKDDDDKKSVKEAFLNETSDVDTAKCKEILNDWIDWEEADYDADAALDQLRSLETENAITEAEYDYIVKNWDELLGIGTEEESVKTEDVKDDKRVSELKFGQTSYDDLVKVSAKYYAERDGYDAVADILDLLNEVDADEAYKLVYKVAEKIKDLLGEELEDCQKYPVESPFKKEERKNVSVQAKQKYPVESPFEKKDSEFVKKEQKAPIKESAELDESLKIISDLSDYKPWSGAVDTWEKIEDAGKVDTLDFMLEDMYPDGLTATELNDLLWFDSDWVLSMVGIEEESEGDDEDSDDEDSDDEELEESKGIVKKGCDSDVDVTKEEADAFAEKLVESMNKE